MKLRNPSLLIGLWLFFFIPLTAVLVYSFAGIWEFPQIAPARFNLRAVRYVAAQIRRIAGSLGMSFAYSITTVAATFIMCILPASVFARRHFGLKDVLETILLAPALLPSIAFSMGIHFVFIKVGLIDNFFGVVMVLAIFSYPYMLRALIAGFGAYGREYDICAENLGAGTLTRIRRVEIPLLLPSIVSGGTVVFLISFSEYFLVFLIGGGAVPSYTGYLFPFLNSADRQTGAALTMIFLIVPILLFMVIDLTVSRRYRKMGL